MVLAVNAHLVMDAKPGAPPAHQLLDQGVRGEEVLLKLQQERTGLPNPFQKRQQGPVESFRLFHVA
jgi:hypothetical protein